VKRWAILVAGLYCLILAVLTVPVIALALSDSIKQSALVYSEWAYWAWLLVMVLSQAALLTVPVRVASRRPVSRRSLWPTILASGFMMGGLAAGALCAIFEFAKMGLARPKGETIRKGEKRL
jgi:hypothetical protein